MNRWGAGTGAEWPCHCRPQRYNAGNPSRRWRALGRSAANCSNQRGCPQTVFTGAGLPGQVGPNAHVRPADRDAAAERQTSGEEHALQKPRCQSPLLPVASATHASRHECLLHAPQRRPSRPTGPQLVQPARTAPAEADRASPLRLCAEQNHESPGTPTIPERSARCHRRGRGVAPRWLVRRAFRPMRPVRQLLGP